MEAEDLAQLYERYHGRVFAYVYARVRDPQLAEDLAADTFVQALANLHTLRDPQACLGWLLSIARNTVAAHYRRRAREEKGLKALGEELATRIQGEDPLAAAEEQELREVVLQQMVRLSPREREVLRLRFEAGLKGGDIANLLGIREVTVRVITFRALAKLRQALARTYTSAGSRR
jgi:RNA polymerase sigma-70 factor (ECF subfamily)